MVQVNFFGPVDSILGAQLVGEGVLVVEAILLVLVVANFVTRKLAHDRHVEQAKESAEAISRFLPHEALNVLLVLFSFYYMTAHYHGGFVLSVLVLGVVLSDFFEFEARKAEARRGVDLDRPKGALAAAVLLLTYTAYQSLMFIFEGPVSAII